MRITKTILILIVTYFLSGLCIAKENSSTTNKPLLVVASIPPFYGLVDAIIQGVSKPKLLIQSGASSHHAVLSPSQIQTLQQADIIFWGGPDLETFLINPLKNVDPKKTRIVELDKTPHLILLPTRFSPNFNDEAENHNDEHEHDHEHEHGHSHDHGHDHDPKQGEHADHSHGPTDMHFWLDPENALLLVNNITQQLSKVYPEHAKQFSQNAAQLKQQIKKLDLSLKKQLLDVRNKPYLVLHDGYQYFEKRYGLNAVGAITHHPELPLSVARLQKIRDIIQQEKVVCIFSEAGAPSKITENLAKEFNVKTGVLNPMENPGNDGDYSYLKLLEGLAASLQECLKQSK